MSDLIRLVYASRACFPQEARADGIEPEVARILAQSRRNNARADVVGALHYADGHFLQCLEGRREAVRVLMARLHTDPRHDRIEILREQAIAAPSFAAWSMKLVPAAADARALLASAGLTRFEPHRFDSDLLDRFLDLLRVAAQRKIESPSSAGPVGDRPAPASRRPWLVPLAATGLVAAGLVAVLWLR